MIGKIITWENSDTEVVVGIVYEVINDSIFHRTCFFTREHDYGFMYRKDIKIL